MQKLTKNEDSWKMGNCDIAKVEIWSWSDQVFYFWKSAFAAFTVRWTGNFQLVDIYLCVIVKYMFLDYYI